MPSTHRQRRRQQRVLERAGDPARARRGSGRCRWPARPGGPRPRARRPRPGRAGAAGAGPTASVPSRCPRATSGTAKPSSGGAERRPACRAGRPPAAGPASSPARSPRARRAAAAASPRRRGVAAASCSRPHSSVVCTAHHWPSRGTTSCGISAIVRSTSSDWASSSLASARNVSQVCRRRSARRSRSFSRCSESRSATSVGQRLGVRPTARRRAPARRRTAGCTVSGTRSWSAPARGGAAVPGQHLRGRRRRRGRAAPRRRPRRPARRAGPAGRRRSRPGASSAYGSGSICSSAVSAPALGRVREPARGLGRRRPRRRRRRPGGPAGTTRPCRSAVCMVPQRLAKWSTSSRPRPRSADLRRCRHGRRCAGRPRAAPTGPGAKSVTVTVSPAGSAATSMSSRCRRARRALVDSSVVSSSASLSSSSRSASASTERTSARAAAGRAPVAGSRTRRTMAALAVCRPPPTRLHPPLS